MNLSQDAAHPTPDFRGETDLDQGIEPEVSQRYPLAAEPPSWRLRSNRRGSSTSTEPARKPVDPWNQR